MTTPSAPSVALRYAAARVAAVKIPASVLYNKGRGGWEYGLGGFADWPSFLKKSKREQVAWAKEFVGPGGQIREPVDISVFSSGDVKFEDGHHRVIAGALLDIDIPVRVRFINFDKDLWPDLLTLLKAGYTRRQYNPQDWKLKGSGVPPLDVVRRGPDAADEWVMSNERVKTARRASGYGEGHMPSDDGPPAHDLLEDGEGFAPPDILVNPHYYTAFKSQLRSFWPTILKAQGKPGTRIKVYRALPSQYDEFNRGDWVTLSYEYAKDHADRGDVSGDDAHVIEATVPASTVRWGADDLMEWGYFGPTVTGRSRTASTRKTAARPIRLPTREIKTLAKRLAQRLYRYGLPKPGRVIAQEYLPLTNVKGDEVVVEILLTGTPGRNRDPFSSKLLNGGFLKRRPEGPLMRVFVNPHLDPRTFEGFPRKVVEDELYRLLAHELTHAADIWSGKGSVGDLSGSKDDLKKHHHNHPAEVRALMRDVVTHLDDGDHVRDLMGYGMDFNTALREALKDTKWPDIEPYLTPRNKKTILKGVYTFLQDQGLDEEAR